MHWSRRRREAQRQGRPSTPQYHLMSREELIAIGALYPRLPAEYAFVFWLTDPNDPERCCPDCAAMADRSPFCAPGLPLNPLEQTPGDGRTRCGADCTCQLSYMDMATGKPKETYRGAHTPWPRYEAIYYSLNWRQRRYVNQYEYGLTADTKPEDVPEWQDGDE